MPPHDDLGAREAQDAATTPFPEEGGVVGGAWYPLYRNTWGGVGSCYRNDNVGSCFANDYYGRVGRVYGGNELDQVGTPNFDGWPPNAYDQGRIGG